MAPGQQDPQDPIVDRGEWHGFALQKLAIPGSAGCLIPTLLLLPHASGQRADGPPHPYAIAVHGWTDAKEAWTELDGYTKGGNVSLGLLQGGCAVLALDMYGHGEHRDGALTADYDALMNEHWEAFFERTLQGIYRLIDYVDVRQDLDGQRLGFLSYSLGGVFAFYAANATSRVKAVATCVTPVFREEDDEYAPYNNLDNLAHTPTLMIAATHDEAVPLADAQWLYSLLLAQHKRFVPHHSGHSLPAAYVDTVVEWFRTWL